MAFVNISTTSVDKHSDLEESEQRSEETGLRPESAKLSRRKTYKRRFECGEKWWKRTVIYEVYVRSFKNSSNNNGIGDLKGIEKKLDYFEWLAVKTLWITPMYPSPMVDFGYDISDFNGIDPMFGTMDDFKSLLRSMKDHGMKMILDFVPNHTSDQHEWFKLSIQKKEPYSDYYVWKSPRGFDSDGHPLPPNNWTSVFRGSAWEYNDTRKQFYLHQFAKEQPDLNFRNPLVIEEMVNVLKFWLELGVDGFRLDAAPHILEDKEFRDNPPAKPNNKTSAGELKLTEDDYCFWNHIYTCNCPGVLDILATFRNVCDEWTERDGQERVLLTEGYLPLSELMEYYGTEKSPIAHFSFNFELLGLEKDCSALDAFACITRWMNALPEFCWPNWQTGNHDQPRIASKVGKDLVDVMNILLLMLPGTAVTYYGEEIGMENTEISWDDTVDPAGKNAGPDNYHLFSRDPERSPMQWSPVVGTAGFCDSSTSWLPINPNFGEVNVKSQTAAEKSHLKTYKALISLRESSKAWQNGDLDLHVLCGDTVLAFTRVDNLSNEGILVVVNFGQVAAQVDINQLERVPAKNSEMTVVVVSDMQETYAEGSVFSGTELKISKRSGIVFKFFISDDEITENSSSI